MIVQPKADAETDFHQTSFISRQGYVSFTAASQHVQIIWLMIQLKRLNQDVGNLS
jgi:hypothetical protein